MLRQQTRRLTSLIDDLLLLAQADAGRMLLELEELDLRIQIQAAAEDLRVLVVENNITVEEDLPADLPVKGDRRLLAMVLQNLVENAAKYTPAGGTIRISGIIEAPEVVLRIGNTGGEIATDDEERIFERFRRGANTGGNVTGHGLGLNIARELARAHGGALSLNPADPGWTEFELRLPAGGGGSV